MVKITLNTDDLVSRYNVGESEKALAESFSVSRSVIRRHLLRCGIEPRNRSAAMALRMARATPEDRLRWSAAAHDAVRGKRMSAEHRQRIARGVQRTGGNTSAYEIALIHGLEALGVSCIPQLACGPYNIDIAVGNVAVEVLGGGWHRTKHHGQRVRYLLDHGFNVLYIWSVFDYRVTTNTAEHVVTFVEEPSSDPTCRRRYRVIRGNGHLVAEFRADRDEIPDVVPLSSRPQAPPASVPYGLCHCGCGELTTVAAMTRSQRGQVRGQPVRYISGHNNSRRPR